MTQDEQKAAEQAYAALISRLADKEPNNGFTSIDQLPALTEAEIASVLRHESTVLADACAEDSIIESVIASLTNPSLNDLTKPAHIGAALLGVLVPQARDYVFFDVRVECSERTDSARLAAAARPYRRGELRGDREFAMEDAGVPLELRS